MTDARVLNWRFVVPDEPAGLLFLAAGDPAELPDTGAARVVAAGQPLPPGPHPAVAVPDLPGWAAGHRRRDTARQVAVLAAAVAPGGWLLVGFGNARFPVGGRGHRLRLAAVRRALRHAGLTEPEVWAPLPDHRRPALLVPLRRAAELDFVLDRLFLTYLPGAGARAAAVRRLLAVLRRGAGAAPHAVRAAVVPSYCLLSRRPA